jgi:hypothetical protein
MSEYPINSNYSIQRIDSASKSFTDQAHQTLCSQGYGSGAAQQTPVNGISTFLLNLGSGASVLNGGVPTGQINNLPTDTFNALQGPANRFVRNRICNPNGFGPE